MPTTHADGMCCLNKRGVCPYDTVQLHIALVNRVNKVSYTVSVIIINKLF